MKAIRAQALTATMAVALLAAVPGQAAEPAEGTIRWGETVEWSGGPLNGTGIAGAFIGDMSQCPEGACDDFLLDVQVPPSPNPRLVRFIEIELEMEPPEPDGVDLMIVPPGGDPANDWTFYVRDVARLIDPTPGIWLIQARCVPVGGCSDTTYTGTATTGSYRLPRAVAHHAGGAMIGRSSLKGRTPTARLYQVGATAWEPTLGVTKDGSLFYQAFSEVQVPKVLHSDDEGETWENVSPRLGPLYRHPTTADPFLYVDQGTSRVFTVDLIPGSCSELSFTDDQGGAWTTTAICEHTDHQHVFTGPPVSSPTTGYPNVVYFCAINAGTAVPTSTVTACSKSLDGGLTFVYTGSPPYHADPGQEGGYLGVPGLCDGVTAHGVVGSDGTIYLPRGWCGQPFVAISRDEGLTWERVQVADNGMATDRYALPSHESGVAVDAKGNLYYVWVALDRLPYLAVSTDGGETWSEPLMIGPPGIKETALPAIDVGRPGGIAIAYMGTENSPGAPFPGEGDCEGQSPVFPVDCPEPDEYDGVTWNGYITISTTALRRKPVFLTAPVNDPRDPLVIGMCEATRCTAAGDFFDVVIGPDGTPWAAFVDPCVIDECTFIGEGVVGRLVGGPPLR